MSKRVSAESVAEALRNQAPELDDIARARMERELLSVVRVGRRSPWTTPSRAFALGVTVTLAAAALFFWLGPIGAPKASRGLALSFESLRNGNVTEQGAIREGGSVRTEENETARIRLFDTQFDAGANSHLRFVHVSETQLDLSLVEGHLAVAFHPRQRGREHLSIVTPNARVEVVGTVFTVTIEESGATRVRVQEGIVRVTEIGHEGALVSAGNEISVGGTRLVERAEAATPLIAAPSAPGADAPAMELAESQQGVSRSSAATNGPAEGFSEHLLRIEAMVAAGRVTEARADLERMSQSSAPSSVRANVWNQLGDIDQGARRYSEAATEYEHAASLGASDAFWSLARVRDRYLHDTDAARPAYENYLRAAPRGAEASLARARLCELGVSEHCSPLSPAPAPGTVAP